MTGFLYPEVEGPTPILVGTTRRGKGPNRSGAYLRRKRQESGRAPQKREVIKECKQAMRQARQALRARASGRPPDDDEEDEDTDDDEDQPQVSGRKRLRQSSDGPMKRRWPTTPSSSGVHPLPTT